MHERNYTTTELYQDFGVYDLLFGMENHVREAYRPHLINKLMPLLVYDPFITIDEINRHLGMYLLLNETVDFSGVEAAKDDWSSPIKHHANVLLNDPRFSPSKVSELPGESGRIVMSCCAAIHNPKGTIRFCLDRLDLEKVRNPNFQKEFNSYTSEELRYVAQNWDEVQGNVVFYQDGRRVQAPWLEMSPQEWLDSYDKTRRPPVKERSRLSKAAGQFLAGVGGVTEPRRKRRALQLDDQDAVPAKSHVKKSLF